MIQHRRRHPRTPRTTELTTPTQERTTRTRATHRVHTEREPETRAEHLRPEPIHVRREQRLREPEQPERGREEERELARAVEPRPEGLANV